MLCIGFNIEHRWSTFNTERIEHMYNIPITEIILPFLSLFTEDTLHTCIIFAGLTFRRVQLSLYTSLGEMANLNDLKHDLTLS